MLPIEIACPQCDRKMRVSEPKLLGRKVRCPHCRTPFAIPTEDELAVLTESETSGETDTGNSDIGVGEQSTRTEGGSVAPSASTFNFAGKRVAHDESSDEETVCDDDSVDEEPAERPQRGSKAGASKPGKSSGNSKGLSNPELQKLALTIGVPLLLFFLAVIGIFYKKGYIGGKGDSRQDGSRFQDYARDVEKNHPWVPKPEPRRANRYNN